MPLRELGKVWKEGFGAGVGDLRSKYFFSLDLSSLEGWVFPLSECRERVSPLLPDSNFVNRIGFASPVARRRGGARLDLILP